MSGAHKQDHARGSLTLRAALASSGVALFLIVLKLFAAARTDSVAMLGSLADTGLDLLASLITLWAVWLAARPADHDHRFGHGKAEAIAALFQVMIIVVSAIGIAARAATSFAGGEATRDAELGIGVSLVAMTITVALLAYQRHVIKHTGSVAIHADHVHYQSDVLLNLAVIAALVLDQFAGLRGADPAFGVAIALWLLWGAWRASRAAIDQLMDKEWPEARRKAFLAVAARHPELAGIHDLRTRSSGAMDFVQFHVWVDPAMTIADAHVVMDEVEAALHREFPGTEILIHLDPEGQVDKEGVLPRALAEEPTR